MNQWDYSIFGLKVRADGPIPDLVPRAGTNPADVLLWLRCGDMPAGPSADSRRPWYLSPWRDSGGRPALTIWQVAEGAFFRFCYPDGAEFLIDRDGRQVWATGLADLPPEEMRFYLLGPVLSFVLRLRGVLCLHASAVVVEGRALAFLGSTGAGKSTTAAALAARGFLVLTDDVAALCEGRGTFHVQPGYPLLCLRPEAIGVLVNAGLAPPELTPLGGGRYLDLDLTRRGYRFQDHSVPLAAVYFLDERDDRGGRWIEPLAGEAALVALVTNTWTTLVLDPARRAEELEILGRLASTVQIRRVRPHADPGRLPRLCDRIVADFMEQTTPPLAQLQARYA